MEAEGLSIFSRWGLGRRERPSQEKRGLKVRASVVLVRGEEILLIRHRRDARFYWVLPGGGLEEGERVTTCAAREVREESGLDVKIRRLLYVAEVLSPSRKKHVLNLIFLGEPMEIDQAIRPSRHWTIEEPRFMPLRDLPSIEMYPPIAFEILEDAEMGWEGPIRFLGNVWVDAEPQVASPPARE
jgi:ADP-ribose pyrophosphatase YjhB (NUDIX family)